MSAPARVAGCRRRLAVSGRSAPQDVPAFEDLVTRLRSTRERGYVEREIDIRLAR